MTAAKLPALLPQKFHVTALAFPDKVRTLIEADPPLEETIKALRGGDGLLHLARDIKAAAEDVNAIQRGRFHLIAHIGHLLPATPPDKRGAQGGRGNKASKPDLPALPFSKPTLATYRKVAEHKEKIDPYFDALNGSEDEPVAITGFIRHTTGHEKAGKACHISDNTGVPEWYTPAEYIEAARGVMGRIDTDPASSAIAQKTVKATRYYTIDDDGLKQTWRGAVWMNPPYTADLVGKFISKLHEHFTAGEVSQACVLVNNATETNWFQQLGRVASAICFPAQRVKFLDDNGNPGAPLQGQAVLYLGTRKASFVKRFRHFGMCVAVQ